MRRPLATGLVLVVTVLTALTGCGGDEDASDGYCATLKDEKRTLARLADEAAEPGKDVLTPTLEALGRLRKASPGTVRDEWDTVYYAWEAMVDAIEETGVDPSDYRPGETPEGVSAADARRLTQVAGQLGSDRVVEASRGLEDHARQVCGVELQV